MSNGASGYDAIVAGTGPGGATTARELARRGKKALMLEWGPGDPIRGSALQAAARLGRPGQSLLMTYNALALVRGVIVGGSSIFYYETAFDPPQDLLAKYGIDIREEVAEAKAELPIAPLEDRLLGPTARRLMNAGQALGLAWEKLPKYIYQEKCRPDCWRCNYGCPFEAKWTARNFVEEATALGSDLIDRARVTRVLLEGRRAIGVEYERRGQVKSVFAPQVIVAAGGIGTPVILRASGLDGAGRDFFFDPLIAVMGEVNQNLGGREIPMSAGLHMKDDGFMITDMTVPKLLYQAFTAGALRPDRLDVHNRTLTVMIKAEDALGGRLTKSGGVRKKLSPDDYDKLHRGYRLAKRVLKRAGAKNIFKSWYLASHPGGTAKINDIVDPNLQTEYEGLSVCDCSVIPESWGRPPTLTLISLGKRLAKRLAAA